MASPLPTYYDDLVTQLAYSATSAIVDITPTWCVAAVAILVAHEAEHHDELVKTEERVKMGEGLKRILRAAP